LTEWLAAAEGLCSLKLVLHRTREAGSVRCCVTVLCWFSSGAGIDQWYCAGLRAGLSGVRVPVEVWNSSIHHRVQTGSEAHPASYEMGTSDSFPGVKAAVV
jgi:hypothetical protein